MMAKKTLRLPLRFEEAVADLLKVKPPEKTNPEKARKPKPRKAAGAKKRSPKKRKGKA